MSIGNLKDQGNQGKNFPWQLKMLLGQQCACDQLTAINANTDQVEFLLSSILTTLQAETEYEAKFVVDTCDSDKVYLEVRVWNPDTSTWGPITYYLPGSATPVTPVGEGTPGCLQYTDPSAVLALILGAIQAGNVILQDIDNNTDGIETILTNLFAAYSAGQQACASSLSVTLCTEQGTDLANIDTSTASLLTAFNAEDFATETTLALIEDVIDNMTFTGGDLNVSANIQVGGTDVSNANPVPISDAGGSITVDGTVTVNQGTSPWAVSLPTGTNTSFYNRVLGGGLAIPAGAVSISVQNIGSDNITITTDSSPATIIDPGISLTFDAQEGKTLGAYQFLNSSGTSLYIVTQVR